jgi:SAM-dependent methyltransferase
MGAVPGGPREAADNVQQSAALIHQLANAFQASQVLFAANEAGLFTFLEEPRSAEVIAAHFGWNPESTLRLLEAMSGLGLTTQTLGKHRNTPATSDCLVPGRPGYQGDFVRHMARAAKTWAGLGEHLRTGRGVKSGRHPAGSASERDYALTMANIGALSAQELLAAVDFSRFRHVLELGSGPGTYAAALLEAYPNMRVTLCDVPEVLDLARACLEGSAGGLRGAFLAGDFLSVKLGAGYDLVLISNVLHTLSPDECRSALRRSFEALSPGGAIMIRDFLLDADRSGPLFSLLFSLHISLHTFAGRTYAVDEMAVWCEVAGFREGRGLALGSKSRLWMAVKPESAT